MREPRRRDHTARCRAARPRTRSGPGLHVRRDTRPHARRGGAPPESPRALAVAPATVRPARPAGRETLPAKGPTADHGRAPGPRHHSLRAPLAPAPAALRRPTGGHVASPGRAVRATRGGLLIRAARPPLVARAVQPRAAAGPPPFAVRRAAARLPRPASRARMTTIRNR
ncbi:hypothetical protein GCM10023324_16950 [Streptomyces youssoufiensis]